MVHIDSPALLSTVNLTVSSNHVDSDDTGGAIVQRYDFLSNTLFQPFALVLTIGSLVLTVVILCLELHDEVLLSILSLIFWTMGYLLLAVHADNIKGRDSIDGYSRGSYYISIIHQVFICPAFLILILSIRGSEYSMAGFQLYWYRSWPSSDDSYLLERSAIIATIGYELKDFLYGKVSFGFLLHHIFTFGGCLLCLFTPAAVGLVTVNCLVAELGSAFSNLYTLYKGKSLLFTYVMAMTLSNCLAGWITSEYWRLETVTLPFRASYLVLAALLIIFRTIGTVLHSKTFMAIEPQKNSESDLAYN